MALDLALARPIAPVVARVERGRLRAFARAIGETDPVHTDVEAARAAGHHDLLVPPTFFFSLEPETDPPLGRLTDLGVDLRGVLHGEQSFTYHRDVHAGEEVANAVYLFCTEEPDYVSGETIVCGGGWRG